MLSEIEGHPWGQLNWISNKSFNGYLTIGYLNPNEASQQFLEEGLEFQGFFLKEVVPLQDSNHILPRALEISVLLFMDSFIFIP